MQFGELLKSSLIKEFTFHYIDYEGLKNALKTPYTSPPSKDNPSGTRKPWSDDDEQAFVAQLEAELDKVFTFQRVKAQEIVRRIQTSQTEVKEVVARQQEADGPGKNVAPPSEDEYALLEEDISDIIADVHDLNKFVRMNYTGFGKIIKKHDKLTSWKLKPVFAARLRAKPFFQDNYDASIIKLSDLYNLVRTKGNPVQGDSAAGGSQQNFVRQTTKYWVHPDNITELKLYILKHLPVLVFNAAKEFEVKDSAISSIYYDNTDTWELYEGRLKKTEGAEAIRLRWYGGMDVDTIFIERKTHREDWTGEKSVKARVSLKEKNVNDFLSGKLSVEKAFEKLRKDGKKSIKEIEEIEQLAREIQYRVLTRKLAPVTRSFYNRTAFQLPGDARVRISLDTELTMVREDNLDGKQRAGKNWRRTDIGIDFPFRQLPDEDVERFQHAVLEVKLQTQAGQEPPEWVRKLVASHLVEAVPKFSKFIHGTAILQPERIKLLPYWYTQIDTDIRKPVTPGFGVQRPGHSTSVSTSDLDPLDSDDDDDEEYLNSSTGRGVAHLEDDENIRRLRAAQDEAAAHERSIAIDYGNGHATGNALDEEEVAGMAITASGGHYDHPLYDSDDEEDDLEEAQRVGGWYYTKTLLKHHVVLAGNTLSGVFHHLVPRMSTKMNLSDDLNGLPAAPVLKRFKAPKGKKIHVPVRVEPKVYLAAERTFLSWLEFSILLGTIAVALLNLTDIEDVASLYSAWGYTISAIASLIYCMYIYLRRSDGIRNRKAINYHDGVGPTILATLLVVSVALNFVFVVKHKGWLDGKPENVVMMRILNETA